MQQPTPAQGATAVPHAHPESSAWLLRTTLALVQAALAGGALLDELTARHPVLRQRLDEAADAGLDELTLPEAVARLDLRLQGAALPATAQQDPLSRLQVALGLCPGGVGCFVLAALADLDPALAPLLDEVHGDSGRPTRSTLLATFGAAATAAALPALAEAGFLVDAPGARRRALAVPQALAEAAAGLPPLATAGIWRRTALDALPALQQLILPRRLMATLQDSLQSPPGTWLLRGPAGSGRRTLAAAVAQGHGLGLLECRAPWGSAAAAQAAPLTGALAVLMGALPLLSANPAPGEGLPWPLPAAAPGGIALRLPRQGGVELDGRDATVIDLDAPDRDERRLHWQHALGGLEPAQALLALRLPRGTLHRAAAHARARPIDAAVLAERLARAHLPLEGVARELPALAARERLVLPQATQQDFDTLVARCRHREALAERAAMGHGAGVRALFKGGSGAGKTLAARALAAALQRPLYRVDLAAAVSKYIGETERNLERVFEAAEALDIVLLLDEGDALLAGRTQVSNAVDRYANLETNYLLQRLEAYDGVLVVTSNAPERIDTAFARRIDVTLEFPPPDVDSRFALWLAHLDPGHQVSAARLDLVSWRCALSGGQIRNAALHATLLALEQGGTVGDAQLLAALEQEYRKAGQHCPTLDEDELA